MRGVLPWLVRWAILQVQEIFVLPFSCSSGPVENIFPQLTVHYYNSFDPIAQQAGQAVVLGRRLLPDVSLECAVLYGTAKNLFLT